MFGKPNWFRERTVRFGVAPATWQGWIYQAAWLTALAVPFLGLMAQRLIPEALIWLTACGGTYWYDMRQVRRQLRRWKNEKVLVIRDESEPVRFVS